MEEVIWGMIGCGDVTEKKQDRVYTKQRVVS